MIKYCRNNIKKIIISLLFTMLLIGCNKETTNKLNKAIEEADKELANETFININDNYDNYSGLNLVDIVYHKDTKVMYTVSRHGVLTVLVDADGQPLIYNKN